MNKYDTTEIFQELEKLGLTPLRIRNGIHVLDPQRRIVAHYACPVGDKSYWEIWPTPTYPLPEDKLTNAYPLTEEILFQFALVENDKKNKQQALDKMVYDVSIINENE